MKMKTKDETKLRNQFNLSEDLRREFGEDFESFKAFSFADAAGRVHISRPTCSVSMSVEQFNDSVELKQLNEKLEANKAELKRLSALQNKIVA